MSIYAALVSAAFGFSAAEVVWEGPGVYAKAWIRDGGALCAAEWGESRDALLYKGLIRGSKGWNVDLIIREYGSKETGITKANELLMYWVMDDPMAAVYMEGSGPEFIKGATEEVLGKPCQIYEAEQFGAKFRVWRWKGLTLKYEKLSDMSKVVVEAVSLVLDPETPDSVFKLPPAQTHH